MSLCSMFVFPVQILVTFSAVSGVILYRVCVFAVMSMNPDPEGKANVRFTVTTTAVVINLLIVLVLDEIYDVIASWITELGTSVWEDSHSYRPSLSKV